MAKSLSERVFSVVGVAIMVWLGWLALMVHEHAWYLFADNWFMSVTMAFGSFIAGATSEGGGAVAFPTMTLLFGIEPHIARDFSLMIQSVGMMAATLAIVFTGVSIERRAVIYGSVGGAIGMIVGLDVVAPRLPPPHTKMFFTGMWASFALALYWMNRQHQRQVLERISHYRHVHSFLLVGVGVIGGCISAITGSGLDILTFSFLVLAFRISEKVATPTSVVLMGVNAVIGFAWKASYAVQPLADDAWSYWYVCVPIVVVGAPLGVHFIAGRSRLFVASFLYASISVQFVTALLIIPQSKSLLTFSAITVIAGGSLFHLMSRYGEYRLRRLDSLVELG